MSSGKGQVEITPLNLVNTQIRLSTLTLQYQNVGDLVQKLTTFRESRENSSSHNSLEVNRYGYRVRITGQFILDKILKGSVEELNIEINKIEMELYRTEIEKDRETRARTRVS